MPITNYKDFPPAPPFYKLLGPSFVILALGLGSGEIILWPYLVSNYGLGIAWGALLGITFQYFMNMEIERYALLKGESVFVGLSRYFSWAAYWFIFSTFIGFGLPGIIAASAKVAASLLGITEFKWLAILFLILIGLILNSGKTVYDLLEKLTKTVLLLGVPFIFILAILAGDSSGWFSLWRGLGGSGDGYRFLPEGLNLAVFLAAFAYAGAGGNLNLTQSIYVKEKGYGMGRYAQKIAGFFRGDRTERIKLEGENFIQNEENISRFRAWWKRVGLEHFLVFWFIGLFSMSMLMLLAYSTAFKTGGNAEGIAFIAHEAGQIGAKLSPLFGSLFLLAVTIMLFQTQLGVLDSTSRIMAENYALKKIGRRADGKINLSKIYHTFLWLQILFGIILFLFNVSEPKTLIVIGAVINAFAMFIHVGLVSILNHKSLPKEFRPGWTRKIILLGIFLFYGFFSVLVFWDKIK